jgi:hypothetical protein
MYCSLLIQAAKRTPDLPTPLKVTFALKFRMRLKVSSAAERTRANDVVSLK